METIKDKPEITVKIKGDAGIYHVWGIDWYHHKMLVERACGIEQVPFDKIIPIETGLPSLTKEGVITAVDKVYEEWLTDGNSRQTLGEVIADALCSEPEKEERNPLTSSEEADQTLRRIRRSPLPDKTVEPERSARKIPTDEEIEAEFPTDLKVLCEIHRIPINFNADEGFYLDTLRTGNVDRQTGAKWLRGRIK